MAPAVTVWTLGLCPTLPRVSATRAPASAVPVMATPCSRTLMTLSPATVLMVGATGGAVSTVSATAAPREPCVPALLSTTALKSCKPDVRPLAE